MNFLKLLLLATLAWVGGCSNQPNAAVSRDPAAQDELSSTQSYDAYRAQQDQETLENYRWSQSKSTEENCPLNKPVQSVKITLRAEKLDDLDVSQLVSKEIKTGTAELFKEVDSRFSDEDEIEHGEELEFDWEDDKIAIYREKQLAEYGENGPSAEEQEINISKTVSNFNFVFATKNEDKTFTISHAENKILGNDPQGNLVQDYLWGWGITKIFPASTDVLLKDVDKLSLQKEKLLHKAINLCEMGFTCGKKLRFYEVNRYKLTEISIQINNEKVFDGPVAHIFALHIDAKLDKIGPNEEFSHGKTLEVPLSRSSAFKALRQKYAEQCR